MAQHRRSMSGIRVQEESKWGADTARERYGQRQYFRGAPAPSDKLQKPQDPVDKHGPGYDNDVPTNSWLRGGNESGKPKR
jgi:hypothetical protein